MNRGAPSDVIGRGGDTSVCLSWWTVMLITLRSMACIGNGGLNGVAALRCREGAADSALEAWLKAAVLMTGTSLRKRWWRPRGAGRPLLRRMEGVRRTRPGQSAWQACKLPRSCVPMTQSPGCCMLLSTSTSTLSSSPTVEALSTAPVRTQPSSFLLSQDPTMVPRCRSI